MGSVKFMGHISRVKVRDLTFDLKLLDGREINY